MQDTHKNVRDSLRNNIRKQRCALNSDALHLSGEALLTHCQTFLDKANCVAGYNAMQGEIPLQSVFNYCHTKKITTVLPIMRDKALLFAPFTNHTTFSKKQYGILEPDTPEQDWLTPEQLDLVLVPLVAFDKTCNRIGMGGGFYDRSFAFRQSGKAPPTLIGVAHAFQEVDNVFAQEWDVALDGIATDKGLIQASTN